MTLISPSDIDITIKLLSATILGGLIGFEREAHGKEAGFRTHAMVCLGSSLLMIVSIQIFEIFKGVTSVDPSRVASQVVTGIGFLGAGAIIREPARVKGLTTAAGVWTASGIGLACGLGEYRAAIITTIFVLIILVFFSKVNRFLDHIQGNKDSRGPNPPKS